MVRFARVVIPGIPHHVVQRGNRRQKTFWQDEDYQEYLRLMRRFCRELGVKIWSYCIMPNHVHLIAVPKSEDGLARGIGEAHRRYTRYINFKKDWRGFLWQGRFSSYPMDARHLLSAVRYIERNPVEARLVRCAWHYQWSSAAAHVKHLPDVLADTGALLNMVDNWREYLGGSEDPVETELSLRHERTGRPLGDNKFLKKLEMKSGRQLAPKRAGRPKKIN